VGVANQQWQQEFKTTHMDLSTNYLGIKLRSPIVVSACTLSEDVSNIARMEEAGAGAVILFSLFEEQIRREAIRYESVYSSTTNLFAEAADFFPDLEDYHVGTHEYLEKIRQAKQKTDLPIIGSLNGITNEGWIDYSGQMEEAGADAIEVNIFFIPADISTSGVAVEQRYIDIIKAISQKVRIPIAVKLNPYFSAIGHMSKQMYQAGANGLVLFNRFYQPDFDINQLKVLSNLKFSDASEIRLPLLWLAILYGRVPVSLAATTGVQSEREVIKYLLAGADVAMTASVLYKFGIDYIEIMNRGLRNWMHQMGFDSVESFKGVMSQQNISDPTAYERANYIKILETKR
jgi:dihydroorotate dehydrogenase (fumarate)